ncbi:unnamed protein product [Camellia sinensis]
MSTKITSSLSDIPSSSTCNDQTFSSDNPTEIAMSHNVDNKEIGKPPSPAGVDHPEAKKQSSILNFLRSFKFCHKSSKPTSIDNKPITKSEPTSNYGDNNISKSEALSKLIAANLNSLDEASKRIIKYQDQIKAVSDRFKMLKEQGGSEKDFVELNKSVMKLKQQISSKHEVEPKESNALRSLWKDDALFYRDNANDPPENPEFEKLLEKPGFMFWFNWERYQQLNTASQLCLLVFSVFPENAEIKKRVMMNWWIGEGLVETEQFANELFNDFIGKEFIKPVWEKRSLEVKICKMDPLVRYRLIKYDKMLHPRGFNLQGAPFGLNGLTQISYAMGMDTLFNVNESFLEFEPEYFSSMKELHVLYLGRWQTSPTHHIEVADIKSKKKNANVLDGLENLTSLRFLSLQGISRIIELPESISKLTNLTILDIRACHNLEVIPDGIGLLKNLTHLDMSECYLLDQMPKGLASLSKLQVLKGFLVSEDKNSCSLDDLHGFWELRKLSIYVTVDGFPTNKDLRALNQFKVLTKLTIAWGRGSVFVQAKSDDSKKKDVRATEQATIAAKKPSLPRTPTRSFTSKPAEVAIPVLPLGLIKLDLQCFPWTITPSWLRAYNLKNLKKLYIRGGKFSDLGQFQKLDDKEAENESWEVEVLRLKYLDHLEMDWFALQKLFPKLNYLEKVKCPKLTRFKCDEEGVWMSSD